MDQSVITFLERLRENNNRDWFTANKNAYLLAKESFDDFINEMIPVIRSIDPLIDLITARDCTFRIYRDVRFSKEKSPYKTNMGAYIARGGKNSQLAGYYIHVEPGQSFLAGGLYMPQPDVLKRVREEIFYNIGDFREIVYNPGFEEFFGKIDDPEKLTNPPKGFPKDFQDINLLKYKNYAVMHYVTDDLVLRKDYNEYVQNIFEGLYPLNLFFNRIFIE
jgi:uncharacterized protein (TIGR02453 family)